MNGPVNGGGVIVLSHALFVNYVVTLAGAGATTGRLGLRSGPYRVGRATPSARWQALTKHRPCFKFLPVRAAAAVAFSNIHS